jgi:hypothetical protein
MEPSDPDYIPREQERRMRELLGDELYEWLGEKPSERRMMMNIEILKLFCSTSVLSISKPWTTNGFTYATDGHIAIKVMAMDGIGPASDPVPNVDAAIPTSEPEKWFDVSELELPFPDVCEECEALIIPDKAITLGKAMFNQVLLYKLRFLPNCKIGPFEGDSAALLRFDGGHGVIMPLRRKP